MRTRDEIEQQDAMDRARRDLTARTQRLLGMSADTTQSSAVPFGSSLLQIRVEQRQRVNALRFK